MQHTHTYKHINTHTHHTPHTIPHLTMYMLVNGPTYTYHFNENALAHEFVWEKAKTFQKSPFSVYLIDGLNQRFSTPHWGFQ